MFVASLSRDPDAADLVRENAESLMELAKLRKELRLDGAESAAEEALRGLEALAARSPESREIAILLEQARELRRTIH